MRSEWLKMRNRGILVIFYPLGIQLSWYSQSQFGMVLLHIQPQMELCPFQRYNIIRKLQRK